MVIFGQRRGNVIASGNYRFAAVGSLNRKIRKHRNVFRGAVRQLKAVRKRL